MKQLRNRIFETNSSSTHVFSFQDITFEDIVNEKFKYSGLSKDVEIKPLLLQNIVKASPYKNADDKIKGIFQYAFYKKYLEEDEFCLVFSVLSEVVNSLNKKFNTNFKVLNSCKEMYSEYEKFFHEENDEFVNCDGNCDYLHVRLYGDGNSVNKLINYYKAINIVADLMKNDVIVYDDDDDKKLNYKQSRIGLYYKANGFGIDRYSEIINDKELLEEAENSWSVGYNAHHYIKNGCFKYPISGDFEYCSVDELVELISNENILIEIGYD